MKKVSENGQLYKCSSCQKIHLEFGNIGMDFKSSESLNELLRYLHTVNDNQFENEIRNDNFRRRLLIPFANTTIKLLLSDQEILELIYLIGSFLNQTCTVTPVPKFASLRRLSSLNSIILN